MGKKDNILDRILTNESINRAFRKAEKLDAIMEKTGKKPLVRDAVNKTLKPLHPDRHEAWKLERALTRLLEAVEKKK